MNGLDTLERLAREATPGPWMGPRITDHEPPGWVGVYAAEDDGEPIPGEHVCVVGRYDDDETVRDAAYIAAASPDVVLALIERVRAAERRADEAKAAKG